MSKSIHSRIYLSCFAGLWSILCLSGAAFASDYYLLIPVKNNAPGTPKENVQLVLQSSVLPGGRVGTNYPVIDRNNSLKVTGDASYKPENVTWGISGGRLPAGLALSSEGKISGRPTNIDDTSFEVLAQYKGASDSNTFHVRINDMEVTLTNLPVMHACKDFEVPLSIVSSISSTESSPNFTLATWTSITPLPFGLTLLPNGQISGTANGGKATPLGVPYEFVAKVDYKGKQVQNTYWIDLNLNDGTSSCVPAGGGGGDM